MSERAQSLEPSGIEHHEAIVNGIRLHYVQGGAAGATPIVLLHGFPQSWLMWRLVLPALMECHFVVAVDLRGYGASEKPAGETGHDQATKAADIYALVRHLGLREIILIGHDRGARVARRYALDFRDELAGVALLDILPAEYVYDGLTAAEAAQRYWHWTFQIVPDLPERLIRGNEDAYLRRFFGRTPAFLDQLCAQGAYPEYLRAFIQPGAVEASLNDYRATYNVDVPRYRAEQASGLRVDAPAMLLWGDRGNLANTPVLDIWREVASDIRVAEEIANCGHYLPEEQPAVVADQLLRFAEGCLEASPRDSL